MSKFAETAVVGLSGVGPGLDESVRQGARQVVQQSIEAESGSRTSRRYTSNAPWCATATANAQVTSVAQVILKQLKHDIIFQADVNEDFAVTAVWGSQQAQLTGQGKYDGVVGWWYGKGPGVDRVGDVLRHANLAGTAEHGGAVALYGDDHSCKCSSVPHQSEHVMMGCSLPIFYPTSVQEILDFGVHAVAMSRTTGLWTSMKLVSEIVETSASVDVDLRGSGAERHA